MICPVRRWVLLGVSLVCAAPGFPESLDGIWRSEGYGYVFQIQSPRLKAFQVTSTNCVAGFRARLQKVAGLGGLGMVSEICIDWREDDSLNECP